MTPSYPQENSQNINAKFSVSPSLPQNVSLIEQGERKIQLAASQEIYKYKNVVGLPMPLASESAVALEAADLLLQSNWFQGQVKNQTSIFINLEIWKILSKFQHNTLSIDEYEAMLTDIFSSKSYTELASKIDTNNEDPLLPIKELANRLKSIDTTNITEISNLSWYTKVFNTYPSQAITGLWQDDKIFSSQRLAGLNPMAIKLVTMKGTTGINWDTIKPKLSPAITVEVIRHFLGKYATFESAIAEKRLFVCDYQALKHATADKNAPGAQKGRILMGPIALFVLTDDFPAPQIAAIQIDQASPGKTSNNFASITSAEATLPGNANKWLMAKMFVHAADLNYNQAVNHLGETHLIEEAFALASHRQLALQHPLYILLSYHFEALMVINGFGQLTLLNSNGLIQQILEGGLAGTLNLIQKAYDKWDFNELDFPARIASRGLGHDTLEYFPYRDDGQLIWDTLGEYISEYLGLYYKHDDDVKNDYELQNWAAEIANHDYGHIHGFKSSIDNFQELATITQRLIWTAGPQHAAVNFPQIDYAAFIPNLPAATYTTAPTDFMQTPVSKRDLLNLLPPAEQTGIQVKTTYALAGFHFNTLLDYYKDLDNEAGKICKKYYDKLTGIITTTITQRNFDRDAQEGLLPYRFFLPENIPNSTSV